MYILAILVDFAPRWRRRKMCRPWRLLLFSGVPVARPCWRHWSNTGLIARVASFLWHPRMPSPWHAWRAGFSSSLLCRVLHDYWLIRVVVGMSIGTREWSASQTRGQPHRGRHCDMWPDRGFLWSENLGNALAHACHCLANIPLQVFQ